MAHKLNLVFAFSLCMMTSFAATKQGKFMPMQTAKHVNATIDTRPSKGITIVEGVECRYSRNGDYLNLDCQNEVISAKLLGTCIQDAHDAIIPEGHTGSFSYEDVNGMTRSCYYKELGRINKSSMKPEEEEKEAKHAKTVKMVYPSKKH